MQDGNIAGRVSGQQHWLDAASTCGLGAGNLCLGANLHDGPNLAFRLGLGHQTLQTVT